MHTSAGNVWAANGVGAVLAEKGRLSEAADVLFAVQVSSRCKTWQATCHRNSSARLDTLTFLPFSVMSLCSLACACGRRYDTAACFTVASLAQDNIAAADGLLPAPDVTLNVANVRLAQQDYYSAIQLYQACLRRHHQNKDATVLLYLARCGILIASHNAPFPASSPVVHERSDA